MGPTLRCGPDSGTRFLSHVHSDSFQSASPVLFQGSACPSAPCSSLCCSKGSAYACSLQSKQSSGHDTGVVSASKLQYVLLPNRAPTGAGVADSRAQGVWKSNKYLAAGHQQLYLRVSIPAPILVAFDQHLNNTLQVRIGFG